MDTKKNRLNEIADQVIRSVAQLQENDPRSRIVTRHLQELIVALKPQSLKSTPPPGPDQTQTQPETPHAIQMASVAPKAQTAWDVLQAQVVPELQPKMRQSSVAPMHSDRPGLLTNRRELRKKAGVTLKQVAAAAKTTLPTARIYELKRTAVHPTKRKALDRVYKSFRRE